jgi:hypothetical protein
VNMTMGGEFGHFSVVALERGPRAVQSIRHEIEFDESVVYGGLTKLRVAGDRRTRKTGVLVVTSRRLLWCSIRKPSLLEMSRSAQESPSESSQAAQTRRSRRARREISIGDWRLWDLEDRGLDAYVEMWRSQGPFPSHALFATQALAKIGLGNIDAVHEGQLGIVATVLRPVGYVTLADRLTRPARWTGAGEATVGQVVLLEEGDELMLARESSVNGKGEP